MKVHLIRTTYTTSVTQGILIVECENSIVFACNTLELPWRNNKRMESCVPRGTYRMVKEYSPKFGAMLWELKDVPGRSECKFHTANYVRQLNGCIAPGQSFVDINGDGVVDITNSRNTLNEFHQSLITESEVQISIYGKY